MSRRIGSDLEHGGWQYLNVVAHPLNLRRRLAGELALQVNSLTFLHSFVLQRLSKLRRLYRYKQQSAS